LTGFSSPNPRQRLQPRRHSTHSNRALLMQDFLRWDDAIASYNSAIAINPEHADAQYNRAMLSLFLGDFATGWPGFEWRWAHAERLKFGSVRNYEQPLWLATSSCLTMS
jgi:tetratricopeptide (TPR) repeat protein